MATKPNCGVCKAIINELEPVCCGLCEQFFHLTQDCCGFTSKSSKDLFKSGKAMFFCSACSVELKGRSMRAYIRDITATQAPAPEAVNDLANQLKQLSDAVSKINGKVDVLSSKHRFNYGPKPAQYASVLKGPDGPGVKRRRSDSEQPAVTAQKGTKSVIFEHLSVANITPVLSPPRFWLYLAGFNPQITNGDISAIVSQCMELPDLEPDIVRLVPKGVDSSKYSFVSYKIGLDPEHKQLALSDVWPKGISFREFEDFSKNSWRQSSESIDNGTPRVNSAMETSSH